VFPRSTLVSVEVGYTRLRKRRLDARANTLPLLTLRDAPAALQDAVVGCATAQYRLGDDVLLNLVRTAVDRDFARVEVSRRDRRGPVGTDRRLVPALFVFVLLPVRQRIGADDFHQELRRRLLDFGAFDLEDRRGGIGLALGALGLRRNDAQLRHLQRLQLHLHRRELLAEARQLDQRTAVIRRRSGELADAAQPLLRYADAGDADALVAEQEFGVVPALVLLADAILERHAHVIEENFVDLVAAVDRHDRAHRNPRCLHVDENEGNAFLLFRARIGAREQENPIRVLSERRPGLLAVDDVVIAVAFRRRLQRGKIGAGAGFGKSLAPPIVEIGDARQELFLLRVGTECVDHRPDHADAERQWRGCRRLLQFIQEDILLHGCPAGAAIFPRPMRDGPALLVQNARPFDELVLAGMAALFQLLADRRRQIFFEEGADLVTKREFLVGKAQVHDRSSGKPQLISNKPAAPMPPPTHIVTTTRLAPRLLPSISAWPVMRAPLIP